MNTELDNVKAALIEITGGSRRNKTARLRDCYDWVMEAKAAGASNKILVNALAKNGLIFDIDTFKHALHRIKKERVIDDLIINSAATNMQENNNNQNPIHKLAGEKKEGKYSPIPATKPEMDKKIPKAEINHGAVDTTKKTFTEKQDTSKYNTD